MELAIFDFDGTLSDQDSFQDFIFFTHGPVLTVLGVLLLSPILLLFLVKIIPNWVAKQMTFSYFYRGWTLEKFDTKALEYVRQKMVKIIRPSAFERLNWHKGKGHRIVVVSASFENYLKPWCESQGIDLLATQIEVEDGKLTGRFSSRNCFGQEKINRIKSAYRREDFSHIYAYGDSKGDLCFTQLTDEFYYKPFGEKFSYQIYRKP